MLGIRVRIRSFLLLVFAANVAPCDRQCVWAFPRILSCLLSASALFAAWTAVLRIIKRWPSCELT